ncbi:MAG: HAMP domain-containing histidine kinase [Candidatus Scalindua sp.]|nr:HAMP domain-containing histidine kinase [Candidatus Scalindua sp.]
MTKRIHIKRGIRWKLLSTMIGLVVGLLILITIVQTLAQKRILEGELENRISLMKENIRERGKTISDHLARLTENGIASYNFSNITMVLNKSVADEKDLIYAILSNFSGRAYVHTLKPEFEHEILSGSEDLFAVSQTKAIINEYKKGKDSFMEFIVPLNASTNQWGVLRIGFSLDKLHDEIAQSRRDILQQSRYMIFRSILMSFIFLLFGIAVVFMISNRLSRPLIKLAESAGRLAKGEFTVTENIKVTTEDEIGMLGKAFIEMSRKLKVSHDMLEESNRALEQKVEERTHRLEEANKALKEQDMIKTEFLSTVSHEIRTPLALVLGFAKIINRRLEGVIFPHVTVEDEKVEKTKKQVRENINIIISEGNRLTDLINELLDISKIESGEVEWKMEPVSVAEIIERAAMVTGSFFVGNRIKFIVDIEEKLPKIVGDKDRLVQVVINLISNAVKFTEAGTITCRARKRINEILVSIVDTGVGIDLVDQNKIFDKFKQGKIMLKKKSKGTGLGLSICKKLIEHHGGRIWVESRLGKGSTFSFNLPCCTGSGEL